MEPILLTERCEYEYCVARGYEPLLDIRNFRLDIRLRVELQRELFGHCVFGRRTGKRNVIIIFATGIGRSSYQPTRVS